MLRLQVYPAQGDPFEHHVQRGPLVIGRSMSAGLTLADPFLSRQQARLFHDGDGWKIEDLGSRNGTWVDGQPTEGPTRLHAGSVVTFSDSRIEVLAEGIAEESTRGLGETQVADATGSTVFKPAAEVLAADDPERSRDPATEDVETLRRRAERLRLLTDVHRALGRSIAIDELLQLLLDKVFDLLGPEEGVIFLRDPDGRLEPAARRSVSPSPRGSEGEARKAVAQDKTTQDTIAQDTVLRSRTLEREVVDKGLAALALDTREDERFASAESLLDFGIRSFLAAPLLAERGEALGMIVLASGRNVRIYSDEDLSLLVSVASVAALRIQNVALAREAFERRRLERELALARRIQVALHASALPEVPGWEIYAGNRPSQGVSGDIYQVLQRPGPTATGPPELVLMVSDVAGKGISASILTATLEALAAGPIAEGQPPEDIATWLSRQLHRRTPPEKYATLFLATLDTATGRFRWVNAGHPPALRVAAGGDLERLEAGGPPVGLVESEPYRAATTTLEPGDLLVLYTDGIVEAADPQGRELEVEGLEAICRTYAARSSAGRLTAGMSASGLAEALDRNLAELTGGVAPEDDRTLVVVSRCGQALEEPER